MAYHRKNFITPSCQTVAGISRSAAPISRSAAPIPRGSAAMRSRSAADSGSSATRRTVKRMKVIENTAPIRKASIVMWGIPRSFTASQFIPRNTRMDGVRYDSVCPSPVKAA